jgi:hypothetical protein
MVHIKRLLKAFMKGVAGMATLTTMLACIVFVGVVNPPDLWSRIGACALVAWAAFSGVCTLLMIEKAQA